MIEKNESFKMRFDSSILLEDNQNKKIYFFKWLKNDGNWIDEGMPLYIIAQEENSVLTANISQPISAPKSGVVQYFKQKGDTIQNGDILCIIHPIGSYSKENLQSNSDYFFYFDKFNYSNPKPYFFNSLRVKEWHKQDGEFISKGELILTLQDYLFLGNNDTFFHYAEKSGYFDKMRTNLDLIGLE